MAADTAVVLWGICGRRSVQLLLTGLQKMKNINFVFHFTAWIVFISRLQMLEHFHTFPPSCCSRPERKVASVAICYANQKH